MLRRVDTYLDHCEIVTVLTLMVFLIPHVRPESFSSIAQLQDLVNSEQILVPLLEKHIKEEERRLRQAKQFLAEVRDKPLQGKTHGDTLHFLGNPINALRVVKRFATGWSQVKGLGEQLRQTEDGELEESGSMMLPEETDYPGACEGIVRLQSVYHLSTRELIAGKIRDERTSALSAEEMQCIGSAALRMEKYNLSVEWLEAAIQGSNSSFPITETLLDLAESYYMVYNFTAAFVTTEKLLALDPKNETLQEVKDIITSNQDITPKDDTEKQAIRKRNTHIYESLCRDEPYVKTKEKRPLICRYTPGHNSYFRFKEEILSFRPRIKLIYDVISNRDASFFKELATPMLFRAHVRSNSSNSYTSGRRVAKGAWLWDTKEHRPVRKMSKRVEYLTGLATTQRPPLPSSEAFHVVNYGIGGQYEPHVDYFRRPNQHIAINTTLGDRIASFLIYLNHVQDGGATVFPRLRLRVSPVKNAAVFWYNYQRNGNLDARTLHAACPILLGHKWIAVKWIRQNGQEFRRRCGKTRDIDYAEED